MAEDARVAVNRDRAPHGSYEVVIHKVCNFFKIYSLTKQTIFELVYVREGGKV